MVLADDQPPSLHFGAPSRARMFRANVPVPLQGAKGLWTFHRAGYARLISSSPPGCQAVRPKPMIVRQSFGHFSRGKGEKLSSPVPLFFSNFPTKAWKTQFSKKIPGGSLKIIHLPFSINLSQHDGESLLLAAGADFHTGIGPFVIQHMFFHYTNGRVGGNVGR